MESNLTRMADRAVSVSLQDLEEGTVPFETLNEAFGPSSLGILLVTGLSPEYARLRSALLCYASYLAALPKGELGILTGDKACFCSNWCAERITDPASYYEVGWSHGKEKLVDDRYDTSKGSFYVNCNEFNPHLEAHDRLADQGHIHMSPNHWPSEELIPGFRQCYVDLCTFIIRIGALVAAACDRYAAAVVPDYKSGFLEEMVKNSRTTKARLLHYFPVDEPTSISVRHDSPVDDAWCATHVDDGALTALTSALYVDETSGLPLWAGQSPTAPAVRADPNAGLHIRSRTGEVIKVSIPESALAFQTGLALQYVTDGLFKAVPHFVAPPKGKSGHRIARNTLAIFMQPNVDEVIDKNSNLTFGKLASIMAEEHS
jgi:isopenicillin N synthase-like dioxygenase